MYAGGATKADVGRGAMYEAALMEFMQAWCMLILLVRFPTSPSASALFFLSGLVSRNTTGKIQVTFWLKEKESIPQPRVGYLRSCKETLMECFRISSLYS